MTIPSRFKLSGFVLSTGNNEHPQAKKVYDTYTKSKNFSYLADRQAVNDYHRNYQQKQRDYLQNLKATQNYFEYAKLRAKSQSHLVKQSPFYGVYNIPLNFKNPWAAIICYNPKNAPIKLKPLGQFPTEHLAAAAYNQTALTVYGQNYPLINILPGLDYTPELMSILEQAGEEIFINNLICEAKKSDNSLEFI